MHTPFPLPDDVFITHELNTRPIAEADYLAEKKALQTLAASMVDQPEQVLPQFVELAMRMTGGASAGLSLYEPKPEPGLFRWHHVMGRLAAFDGATTPRNYSPCGVTLDARAPVLTRHCERLYSWISDAGIVVPEVQLVPLYIAGEEPLGTLWIVSDDYGHFNSDHARIAAELATFVGIALHILRTTQQLRTALEDQETLTREMHHRVQNVFSVTDSIIRFSARGNRSTQEMTSALTGRLRALASAHALVMRKPDPASTQMSTLAELVATIVAPHLDDAGGRITVQGPDLPCGERAINGLSLVLHELATNAAKYGGLATEGGTVAVRWTVEDDVVTLTWTEDGGALLEGPPQSEGFGSKLVQNTVRRQLDGSVEYSWNRQGLEVTITVPVASIAG